MDYFSRKIDLDVFVEEIQSTLRKYESTGHVTEDRIIEAVMNRIKFLGSGMMTEQEDLINIKNSVGKLPSNLFSILDICKCKCIPLCRCGMTTKNPCGETIETPTAIRPLQPHPQRVHKFITTNKYDEAYKECTTCHAQIDTSFKTEYEFIPDVCRVNACDREDLSLGGSFLKEHKMCCVSSCAKYKAELSDKLLKTTFAEGTVYIKYLGIPLDEDRRPLILDSEQGAIYEHLRYFTLARILEYIQFEDESAYRQYSDMLVMSNNTTRAAIADAKASSFTNKAFVKLWNTRRKNTEKYFTNSNLNK